MVSSEIEVSLATPHSTAMFFLTKKLEFSNSENKEVYIYVAVNEEGDKSTMGIIEIGKTAGSREEIVKLIIK